MKITLFFLIVGLSGCFAVSAPAQPCSGKMTENQVTVMAMLIFQATVAYNVLKDTGNICYLQTWMFHVSSLLQAMAAHTGCPMKAVITAAVACVPGGEKVQAAVTLALVNQDCDSLLQAGVTLRVMMTSICDFTRTVMTNQGYNLEDALDLTLFNLCGAVEATVRVADTLRDCGVKLSVVKVLQDGQVTLTLNEKVSQVGSLLGPLAGPLVGLAGCLLGSGASVAALTNSVTTIIAGLTGGLLSIADPATGKPLTGLTGRRSRRLSDLTDGLSNTTASLELSKLLDAGEESLEKLLSGAVGGALGDALRALLGDPRGLPVTP